MLQRLFVVALLACPAGLYAQNQFDPAIFKSPPAQFRGHAMWSFNLTDRKSVV